MTISILFDVSNNSVYSGKSPFNSSAPNWVWNAGELKFASFEYKYLQLYKMAGDFRVRNVQKNHVTTCFCVCYSYNFYRTKELTSTILYSNGLLHRKITFQVFAVMLLIVFF